MAPFDTLTVQIAAADGVADYTAPYWRDVSSDVRSCEIRSGRSSELEEFEASTCTVVLDNRTRQYDPTHSGNQWWTTYLDTPGTSAGYARASSSTVGSITGDLDIRAHVLADDWTPTSERVIVAKWQASGSRSYYFALAPSGYLRLRWYNGTSTLGSDSTVPVSITDGTAAWVRAVLDVNDGSGNHTIRYYTGDSRNGPWTQLGSTITTAGTTSVASSTLLLTAGATSASLNYWAGEIEEVIVLPQISGTPDWPGGAWIRFNIGWGASGTSSTDYAGNTWTVGGSASIQARPDTSALNGSHLKPYRLMRVTIENSGGGETALFYGFLNQRDAISLAYDRALKDATATIKATDVLTLYAAHHLDELDTPTGDGQLPSTRLFAVALEVTGTSVPGVFDAGYTPLAATTYGESALEHLHKVAQAEGGAVWVEPGGDLRFDDRYAPLTNLRMSTSQATFGPSNTPYADLVMEYADEMANAASITCTGTGVTVTEQDDDSVAAFGKITYTAELIARDTPQAEARAQWIVDVYGRPAYAPREIVVLPLTSTAVADEVLSLMLRDRVTVLFTPPGASSAITFSCNIEGITHSFAINPSKQWRTTYRLSLRRFLGDYDDVADYLELDSASRGLLNTGRLGY